MPLSASWPPSVPIGKAGEGVLAVGDKQALASTGIACKQLRGLLAAPPVLGVLALAGRVGTEHDWLEPQMTSTCSSDHPQMTLG